jgi:acetoin utilization deacetylase AcuC-like enzyme
MGSGESHFARRTENFKEINDYNSVHVNFIGGGGYPDIASAEDCPADKLVLAHCN